MERWRITSIVALAAASVVFGADREAIPRPDAPHPRIVSFSPAITRLLFDMDDAAIDFTSDHPQLLHNASVDRLAELLDIDLTKAIRRRLYNRASRSAVAYRNRLEAMGQLGGEEEDYTHAVSLLEAAVAADSTDRAVWATLGRALWAEASADNGESARELAREGCLRALALDSTAVYPNMVWGSLCEQDGRPDDAIAAYRRVMSTDPKHTTARRRLAEIYIGTQGRQDEAEAMYREGFALKPDYWEEPARLGYFFDRLERTDEAIEYYQLVLALAPEQHWTLNRMGIYYHNSEDLENAQRYYLRCLAVRPDYNVCNNLGTLMYFQGRFEEAGEYYELALIYSDSTNEDYYRRLNNLAAALYWVDGQRDRTLEIFRDAITLGEASLENDPENAVHIAYLAGLYAMTGDEASARKYARLKVASESDDSFVMFLLGCAWEKLGERELALHHIGNAARNDYPLTELQAEQLLKDLVDDVRFLNLIEGLEKSGPDQEAVGSGD